MGPATSRRFGTAAGVARKTRRAACLTVLFALGHVAAPGAASAQTVRTPPYDAGIVCSAKLTVRSDGYQTLWTPMASDCQSDDDLSKHGILAVGGAPVPGTSVHKELPTQCLPDCTCIGPICFYPGNEHVDADTQGHGARSTASALVRIVVDRTGSLAVTGSVSGQSTSPVCLELLGIDDATACTQATAPEATLTVTSEVVAGEEVWASVRTGPSDLGHRALPAPGVVAVRSVSYAVT